MVLLIYSGVDWNMVYVVGFDVFVSVEVIVEDFVFEGFGI